MSELTHEVKGQTKSDTEQSVTPPGEIPDGWSNVTFSELEDLYFRYISTTQVECAESRRIGSLGDGGWDVCVDASYTPKAENCVVFSFGISDNWSFDDGMSKVFGCQVHSYDPTINYKETLRGDRVHFHPVGLSDAQREQVIQNTGKFPVDSLENLVKEAGYEQKIIDYVKFDIEGCEWQVIPQLISSGILKHIKQIAFEAHTWQANRREDANKLFNYWRIIVSLHEAGLRLWHSHLNKPGSFISKSGQIYSLSQELYFLNSNMSKP